MKRRKTLGEVKLIDIIVKPSLLLIALATLCDCAISQENTANDLVKKSNELLANGSVEAAAQALDKAIQLYNESTTQNPNDAKAWLGKANTLNSLALFKNDTEKFNESLAAYNSIRDDLPRF